MQNPKKSLIKFSGKSENVLVVVVEGLTTDVARQYRGLNIEQFILLQELCLGYHICLCVHILELHLRVWRLVRTLSR